MEWETVWDIRDIGHVFSWVITAPIVFAVVGAFLATAGRRIVGSALGLFGLLFIAFMAAEYVSLRQAVTNNTYKVAEGTVENFHPGREVNDPNLKGSHLESFVVDGISFSYHHRDFCFCFNKTDRIGGPIHEGLIVRIWHVDNRIIHLEIKQ